MAGRTERLQALMRQVAEPARLIQFAGHAAFAHFQSVRSIHFVLHISLWIYFVLFGQSPTPEVPPWRCVVAGVRQQSSADRLYGFIVRAHASNQVPSGGRITAVSPMQTAREQVKQVIGAGWQQRQLTQ